LKEVYGHSVSLWFVSLGEIVQIGWVSADPHLVTLKRKNNYDTVG